MRPHDDRCACGHAQGPQPCRLGAPSAFNAAAHAPRTPPSVAPSPDTLTASLAPKGGPL